MQPDKFTLWPLGQEAAKRACEAIVREVQAERFSRGEDYLKNWDMYQNRHEQYFKRRLDEAQTIFDYRKTNAIKSNLCGFTVDLSARYLYGKSSKIVRRFSENTTTNDKMRALVDKFHLESFLLDAAKKASIYGEAIVRLVPVDEDTNLQVDKVTTPTTYPHPVLMEPVRTYVKKNRFGNIAAVVSQYFSTDYATGKKYSLTELVVDDSRWVWRSEGTMELLLYEKNVGTSFAASMQSSTLLSSSENPYKLANEFVHFINNEDLKSDISEILDLNIALDEALTDKQHFFAKHGWPQLVSEVSLQNVSYSPNKIWEISPDIDDKKKVLDRLGFLTWDGKMEDHAKYIKNLERNIMILSNTAAISTGDLEAIGQLRSGAALITAHSVAIHKTESKQIIWDDNEKRLYYALAAMDAFFHSEKKDGRFPELEPEIRFPKDFVPGAELERVQIQQMQFNSHLKPLEDIIEEEYGDISPEQVKEKYDKIMKDAEQIVDSTRKFETEEAAGGSAKGKSGSSTEKSQQQKSTGS